MTPTDFEELLNVVSLIVSLKNTSFRQALPSSDKLAVILRYLASCWWLARQFDVLVQNIQGIHF
jgi:hypothetical protein